MTGYSGYTFRWENRVEKFWVKRRARVAPARRQRRLDRPLAVTA
jgi:hypothetical protein